MRKCLFFAVLLALATACAGGSADKLDALYEGLPFTMPRVSLPSIPAREVALTDFGGVGDGVTLNTDAFAKAIAALSEKGGGRLVVPAGIWLTGPIGLANHIELRVEKDAVIVFSTDQDLYPIIDTNFEGLDVRRCLSPIHAEGAHDIAITGGGIIDGSGDAWREVKRRKVSDDQWKVVLQRGGLLSDDGKTWFPDEGYAKARATAGSLNYPDPSLDEQEIKTFLRPVLVSLRECSRVLIEDCTFQNSPCWNLHPLYCQDVVIRGITVRNPHYSANGDGIDIDACENVILTDSSFDVGDDAICIKSGKDEDGRRHARKCRNLIISDCTVYHGHGGFVVGSEMSGGVENIRVTRCRFIGTDVGLRFKSTRGRGGLVKDIWCDHIYMKDIVTYGVIFNLYYAGVAATDMDPDAKSDIQPVDETTPEFRDIHVSDVLCAGADQAIFINGLPELPVRNIDFRNSNFTAEKGEEVHFAENITFDNVTINGKRI
ncbi:MAG: glycoside hydrolase family 28 protein [Kiritimatiellae bacterium]|nr:glycoside hydrolase family 28 protein [Kiritimatiellia bacterium]MBQ6299004.1 glycoside hydrolase family 28 protein [Bacteroidales bacterium]